MAWELSLWHLKWCSKDYLAFVFSFIGGWWHDKMAWKFFRTSWKQREIASYFVPFQLVRPKLGWEYPWVSKLKVQCQLNESFRYRMEFSNPSLHTLLFHHSNLILTHLANHSLTLSSERKFSSQKFKTQFQKPNSLWISHSIFLRHAVKSLAPTTHLILSSPPLHRCNTNRMFWW